MRAAVTRVPAGRAAIRCAALRFRSSGRSRFRHRPRSQASEKSCPMQRTRQHSASFSTSATTAAERRPRSWLFHFVTPATPAFWQLPSGGRHRFSASSPAVVHTPLRSDSLLPSTLPITHARGTKKRRRYLSEPFPPTPSRHYKRERAQVACAGVTANRRHPAAARRVALSLSASVLQQRLRMERRHQ